MRIPELHRPNQTTSGTGEQKLRHRVCLPVGASLRRHHRTAPGTIYSSKTEQPQHPHRHNLRVEKLLLLPARHLHTLCHLRQAVTLPSGSSAPAACHPPADAGTPPPGWLLSITISHVAIPHPPIVTPRQPRCGPAPSRSSTAYG